MWDLVKIGAIAIIFIFCIIALIPVTTKIMIISVNKMMKAMDKWM